MSSPSHAAFDAHNRLSLAGRILILVTAFLGWGFAGVQMSLSSLSMRSAAIDLLGRTDRLDRPVYHDLSQREAAHTAAVRAGHEETVAPLSESEGQTLKDSNTVINEWISWYLCAFLFGAAAGGLIFGQLGDIIGRSNAMGLAIACYSIMSGLSVFAQTPEQLLVLRFITCMGVGGMWPNGVALVSEAWAGLSRPMVAGLIGTSANIGIYALSQLAEHWKIEPDAWHWSMLVGASPVILAVIVFAFVPESPVWLASRGKREPGSHANGGTADDDSQHSTSARSATLQVFLPPLLSLTLIGIALATIPLIGGWGSANWMVPWADKVGAAASPPNHILKAEVNSARALTSIVGSLIGGWVASLFGRRATYFAASLGALVCAQYAFWFTVPTDESFLFWVSAIGFFNGLYFGWLPLCLPEMFPTSVRSTGAGVSFNFGRILTAVTVFLTGALMTQFGGDYARIGQITSLVFALGIAVVWLIPNRTDPGLDTATKGDTAA